jgi:hypothetical protein
LWHAIRTHVHDHFTNFLDFLFYLLFWYIFFYWRRRTWARSTKNMSVFKYWWKPCDPLFSKNEKGEKSKYFLAMRWILWFCNMSVLEKAYC